MKKGSLINETTYFGTGPARGVMVAARLRAGFSFTAKFLKILGRDIQCAKSISHNKFRYGVNVCLKCYWSSEIST